MKATVQTFTICVAAALSAATSPMSVAAPPGTGIQGQAFLYIAYTPVEIEPGEWWGVGNVQLPVATTFTVLSAHNRREVARVTTDANGLYSVSLPPGRYLLVPDALRLSAFLNCSETTEPIEVAVQSKQFSPANLFYFRQGPCPVSGTPIQVGDGNWELAIPFAGAAAQEDQNLSAVTAKRLGEVESSTTTAQSVFQASLLTPPAGARLIMGRFYFRVDNDDVEFMAIVFPFGSSGLLTSNLNPVLSVPGRAVEFSLGEGASTTFHGLYTYVDHNPFLPFEPPFHYDEDGNPYLIDAPVIRFGYVYTGHFRLPAGFERQLLTGRGTVQFNEYISGSVTVAAVTAPGKRRR